MPHTQGNIHNITALANDTELSVITLKTLKYITHNSLGSLFGASPDNPTTIINGGSAIFRIQRFTKWEEYTFANRNDPGDLIDNTIALTINFDKHKKSHYEIETLDLQKLDLKTRSEYLSMIQGGIQITLTALLDALFLKTAVDNVRNEKNQAKSQHKQLVIASIDNLNTETKRKDAYRNFTRKAIDLTRQITDEKIGVNITDFATFLHLKVINDMIMEMPQGGDSATAIGTNLATVPGTRTIGGITAKDHILLNQNVPKNTSFDKETDFDFSNIFGAIFHKEAIFCAIQGLLTTAMNDPHSGNQKYIMKFSYGTGVVREMLFALIVKTLIPVKN